MKTERIWYVVMNAHRARILRGLPGPHQPAPVEITMQAPRRTLRDALRDRPTRSFSSGSDGRRSGVEPGTDPLREDATSFLREVFDYLSDQNAAHSFDGLVLVASPEIVGLWRNAIPDGLKPMVRSEIAKNIVRLPVNELAPALRDLVEQ